MMGRMVNDRLHGRLQHNYGYRGLNGIIYFLLKILRNKNNALSEMVT
jgi:hypothetical protein